MTLPTARQQITPAFGIPLKRDVNTDADMHQVLDAMIAGNAKSASTTTPPHYPANGDVYIVPTGATGAWAGRVGQLAVSVPRAVLDGVATLDTKFVYITPPTGISLWVADVSYRVVFNGTAWVKEPAAALSTTAPPATAGLTGAAGEIRFDASFVYICTAANVWKRSPLTTW